MKAATSREISESDEESKDKADAGDDSVSSLKVTVTFDLIQVVLFIVAAVIRFVEISKPRAIVFDEILFGKYAMHYLDRKFYFDLCPPLGKMLVAVAAQFAGVEGNFTFEKIGQGYTYGIPVFAMRFLPALCGSLLVPAVYQIIKEMKFHSITASLGALLVILDNSLHVQSRFIMMESVISLLSTLSLIGFLQFRRQYNRPFSMLWWFWLCFTGLTSGLSGCIKYGGVFTGLLILGLTMYDFWMMILPDKSLNQRQLVKHIVSRCLALIGIPVYMYCFLFSIHLILLYKSGPYDGNMSSHFQASLEGGLAALTKGQPQKIVHGSQITLRHTVGKPCWLHSHNHTYPVSYPDGRKSSQQQQVTCYPFKDVFNWWIVKRPEIDNLHIEDIPKPIKNGEIIQLVHGKTVRFLNSHNVAAPVTPLNQEVTCYINYSIGIEPQSLWRVNIINKDTEGEEFKIITSQIQLIHVNSSQALKTTGVTLPDWGFYQNEVVTDTLHGQQSTVWNVEEHRYTENTEAKGTDVKISLAGLIPTEPIHMSIFEKFKELQKKMLFTSQDVNLEHRYSSTPLDWPLGDKTVAYWIHPTNHAQIHLIGNLALWYTGVICIMLYCVILVVYLLAYERNLLPIDIPKALWLKFKLTGEILILGYAVNYLPYFLTSRTLFLHHYLPAVPFKLMVIASMVEILHHIIRPRWMKVMLQTGVVAWLSGVIYVFQCLRVINQGTTVLYPQDLQRLAWKETWDFVYH